jgi:uncharacterized membrane protein YgcG
MRKFLRLLLCAAAACALAFGAAAPASAAPDAGGFTITDYTVDAVVSPGNVYDVTETIRVNFYEPGHHGIYRNIPYKGTMRILDDEGTEIDVDYRASVRDIRVQGYDYSVSTTNGYKEVKIGSADYTVRGDQTYVISYKIGFGNDGIPDFDMLNFNIIGPEWDTTIDHVRFSVTMPDEFDASKLGFNVGRIGSSGYDPDALRFGVSGNTISGEVVRQLWNNQAVTVTMKLPQGYFKLPDLRISDWIMMGFLALLVLGAVLLFLRYGRDEKPVNTVEFGPPDGFTSAEVGYVNDGVVDTRDVVSLILYWADKGYLAIKEENGSFTLIQAREMGPEAKSFEKHMFDRLFQGRQAVTTDDLKYSFYTTVSTTKSMVADSFARSDRRVFTKASTALKPVMSFFAALPVMLTLFMTFWRNGDGLMPTLIYTCLAGAAILLPVFFLIGTLRRWRAYKPGVRVLFLILEIVFLFVALAAFIAVTSARAYEPMLPWWAAMATLIVSLVSVFIVKRTPKGVEWLGKINGFRDFIMLAERDRLVAMVEQNPNYFYSVLPFAYVLNVTDKWAKKFETVALEPPQWYYGYNYGTFNSLLFMSSLNHSMNSFQTSMTSTPSNNGGGGSGGFGGGGGFSGGGFSGGGGGGGGGGSW